MLNQTVLNRSGKNRLSCIVPDLKSKTISFFIIQHDAFYHVKKVSFFAESLDQEWMLDLLNAFSTTEMNRSVFHL